MDITKILINAFKILKILVGVYIPTLFTRIYMILLGYSVGGNFRIGINSWIYGKNVKIGDNVVIGNNVKIYANNMLIEDYVIIEDNVTVNGIKDFIIYEYSNICNNVMIEGDKSITIGENVWIGRGTLINVRDEINIGNNTGIGQESMLWTHGHWAEEIEGYPVKFGNIIIKDNVWITPRTIILPGVTIGKNAIISAGSVVTKDIPLQTLNAGVPAKIISHEKNFKKTLKNPERINILIKYFFLKINGTYNINQLSENMWICERRNYKFMVVVFKEIRIENVSLIIEKYRNVSEFLLISEKFVPSDTKNYVKKLNNITVFDLENKTYRKANTICEALLKQSVYDRVARFVKEKY